LALARTLGCSNAAAPLIAFIDDDTVLAPDYLATAVGFLAAHPQVAAVSGRISPDFEVSPPSWIHEFNTLLALRDFGDQALISCPPTGANTLPEYPRFAPVGVNICRREFFNRFRENCDKHPVHFSFGRNANSLASGEDNDFIISIIRSGAQVAYCPELQITHIIPERRLTPNYLGRLNRASSKTWLQVLLLNGISSWPAISRWTLPLRKLRAWFSYRAWRGPREWIRWQGACGHFEGRAAINHD